MSSEETHWLKIFKVQKLNFEIIPTPENCLLPKISINSNASFIGFLLKIHADSHKLRKYKKNTSYDNMNLKKCLFSVISLLIICKEKKNHKKKSYIYIFFWWWILSCSWKKKVTDNKRNIYAVRKYIYWRTSLNYCMRHIYWFWVSYLIVICWANPNQERFFKTFQ